MADIAQTPANVKLISGSLAEGTAGETIVQGEPIYIDTSGNAMKTQCDGTAAQAAASGIAITTATVGGKVFYATPGSVVNLGATLTLAETYVVSVNLGKIAPISDLGPTHYSTTLGPARTTANLFFSPVVSGAQKP